MRENHYSVVFLHSKNFPLLIYVLPIIIYFELYPHPERSRHAYLTSIVDIYSLHSYLTFISDIYILHLYLTFISNIATYLWHLYLAFIFDVYIWHLYLTFVFEIATYIWHFYLALIYDIYIWHVVPYIFHDCFQNSREKCIEYIFHDCFQNSREKWIGSPNPLFYRCICFRLYKTMHLTKKNRTKLAESERHWRLPSSPIVENKTCIFLM